MSDTNRWVDVLSEIEVELGGQGRRAGVRPRQAIFLDEYANTFNVSAATSRADVSRTQFYRWKSEDPTFFHAWEQAQEAIRDQVLGELYSRAVHGVEIAIRDRRGDIIGSERKASDRLLLATARALDPRFAERATAPPVQRDTSWRADLARILADPVKRQALEDLHGLLDS